MFISHSKGRFRRYNFVACFFCSSRCLRHVNRNTFFLNTFIAGCLQVTNSKTPKQSPECTKQETVAQADNSKASSKMLTKKIGYKAKRVYGETIYSGE